MYDSKTFRSYVLPVRYLQSHSSSSFIRVTHRVKYNNFIMYYLYIIFDQFEVAASRSTRPDDVDFVFSTEYFRLLCIFYPQTNTVIWGVFPRPFTLKCLIFFFSFFEHKRSTQQETCTHYQCEQTCRIEDEDSINELLPFNSNIAVLIMV